MVGEVGRSALLSSRSPEEEYTQFYRDSAGLLWFPYSSPHHPPFCRGWICLSDPGNNLLPADPSITFPAPDIIPPAKQAPFVFHLTDWHVLAAVVILFCAVLLVRRAYNRRILQKSLNS